MRTKTLVRAALALGIVAMLEGVSGMAQDNKPAIDAQAEKYLKQMCSFLGSLKQFTFEGEELIDEVLDNGQKLQFSHQRKASVSRPNKIFAEFKGDLANRQFYFNGDLAMLYDKDKSVYGSQPFKGTVDGLIDMLHHKLGFTVPLSDLVMSDAYKILTQELTSGAYVGKHNVGGIPCHHLAFTQKLVDWQIWIDDGDEPLPRKMIITQKQLRGEPQFTAVLSRWDTAAKLTDSMFEFTPPNGVRQIDFLRVPMAEESKTRKPSTDGK
jgi:hypothetical protein